jgi:hypothetical protein
MKLEGPFHFPASLIVRSIERGFETARPIRRLKNGAKGDCVWIVKARRMRSFGPPHHRKIIMDLSIVEKERKKSGIYWTVVSWGITRDSPSLACPKSRSNFKSGIPEMGLLIHLRCLGTEKAITHGRRAGESRFRLSMGTASAHCCC